MSYPIRKKCRIKGCPRMGRNKGKQGYGGTCPPHYRARKRNYKLKTKV